jgi:uncharacterized protein (TIGR03066 family)
LAVLTVNLSLMADDMKEEKVDAEKLIGKWKAHEVPGKYLSSIEFRKNGTMRATVTYKTEEYHVDGKYRTEKNKVMIVVRDDVENESVYIVNKLTDTELVWTSEKSKQKETYIRLKDN